MDFSDNELDVIMDALDNKRAQLYSIYQALDGRDQPDHIEYPAVYYMERVMILSHLITKAETLKDEQS